MNPHLDRAVLLLQQNRAALAEQELRQVLGADPEDPYAHALLGYCLNERKQFQPASEAARKAIHLAPEFPYAHYVHAKILYDRNRHQEALAAVREAIRLDPADADYAALEGAIQFHESNWPLALASAERGLESDPEHVGCTNLRAMALVKLGRRSEAGSTIEQALAKNPENSVTHANRGWALLESGRPEKALHHFQEALRLDPENDWARQGIVEALKARHLIYSIVLKYFFFMARLSSRAQWGIILAGYFGNRVLSSLARANPDLAPWVLPVRVFYVLFVFLTWTADPLSNLLLRLNRYGRLALTPAQVNASNWVGACVGLALVSLVAALATSQGLFAFAALIFGGLIIPLAGTFKCYEGWPRNVMLLFTAVMAFIGIAFLVLNLSKAADRSLGGALFLIFFLGMIGSPWLANVLMSQRPRL